MPVVNPLARELVFKVVYYGPGLGGKTSSLQYIHNTAKPEHRGKMVSLATPVDRTLYFDFLPIRMPTMRGLSVRLQLFTVPGQVYYNATRKLVLTGVDGLVFVCDSQEARLDANLESLINLKDNLLEHGRSLDEVPHVLQYNKRDLEDTASVEQLEEKLNLHGVPSFATVATRGDGLYEGLEAITLAVLEDFERRAPRSRQLAQELELPEGGLADALRSAHTIANADSQEGAASPAQDIGPSGILSLTLPPMDQAGERAARTLTAAGGSLPPPSDDEVSAEPARTSEPTLSDVTSPAVPDSERGSMVGGVSFESLASSPEREQVRELEGALARRQVARAVLLIDALLARVLANTAVMLGGARDAPRDPAVVALLLGIEGRRYLELRAVVKEARQQRPVTLEQALAAYAVLIQALLARNQSA